LKITETVHWADQTAQRIISEKGKKDRYTVAAGITPSGTIHIGNFREIITVELISRALLDFKKKVRFIYSWDDFDVFRKVPTNMPNQELLKKHLRMPITEIPDTFDCNHSSFAEHNEKLLEENLPEVGIHPEFIRQSRKYRDCDYALEIDHCLRKTKEIKQILDKYRSKPLDDAWLPVSIFCEKCNKDTVDDIQYKGNYIVRYKCSCGHTDEFDIRKKGIIKLNWRVDWPMRWHFEKVDCEPAGKDHFAAGGSRESGVEMQKAVWDTEPPIGFMYEWIGIKGGSQFSSSAGVVITLKEMLEIYEPEIIRFLFVGTRPNTEFSISFDLDVIKIYEDFDKLERIYFGKEDISKKKHAKQKRIYELSCVGKIPKKFPFQPSFRHLTSVIQIYDNDIDRVIKHYKLKTRKDKEKLIKRAELAKNWLEKHAPDDFKFSLIDKSKVRLTRDKKELFNKLANLLKKKEIDEKELHAEFYNLTRESGIEPKEFFETAYLILIDKKKGPQLASFILTIGREKVAGKFRNI